MQKVLSWGENLSVFIMVRHLPLIFSESRARPTCTMVLTKIPWNFFNLLFFSHLEEGKGAVKESESVTDTPPYFKQNIQTNPMSVRGDHAATSSLYVISPYLLLDLES